MSRMLHLRGRYGHGKGQPEVCRNGTNNDNNSTYQQHCDEYDKFIGNNLPMLRRSGSSTLTSSSLSSLDNDYYDNYENDTIINTIYFEEFSSSGQQKSSSNSTMKHQPCCTTSDVILCDNAQPKHTFTNTFPNATKTILIQLQGMTNDFKENGLPWKNIEKSTSNITDCRSYIAGLSGILYCLPAFCCHSNDLYIQFTWILQACLSIMADYVYINQDSYFHGIDRFYAAFNLINIIRHVWKMQSQCIIWIFSIIPIGCFVLANHAKQQLNFQLWKYYHGLWHLSSSILVAWIIHLLYS